MNRRDHDQFHVDLLAVVASGCRLQIDDQQSIPSQSSLVSSLRTYQSKSGLLLGDSQPAEASADQVQLSSNAITAAVNADPLEAFRSSGLPTRYIAALQSFALTRQMTPILDGLSVRCLGQEQLRRILYWPTLYLLMLLAVGSFGLRLFYNRIVPLITDFRADADPSNKIRYEGTDFQAWFPFIAYGMIALGLFAILFLFFGGATLLVRLLGGKRYIDELISSVCLGNVPVLMAAGLSKENSVRISCDLSGMNEESKQKLLKNLPSDDPGYWRIASDFWSASARSRLARLKFIIPLLLVLVFGGLFSVAYCMALFGPLFTVISKLSQ